MRELEKKVTELSARLEVSTKKQVGKVMLALGLVAFLFIIVIFLIVKRK